MATQQSEEERAFIDYVHSLRGKFHATIPAGFDIASSHMTTGKFSWRPCMYDDEPYLSRPPTVADWAADRCNPRDAVKDHRIYVVMKDGSSDAGWVRWDDVPTGRRRAAAATKQRMTRVWCELNGLMTPAPRRSTTATTAGSVADASPVVVVVATDPSSPPPSSSDRRHPRACRSRQPVFRFSPPGAAAPAAAATDAYDGRCNEQLYPGGGARHGGVSSVCSGPHVRHHGVERVAHFHSTNASTSTRCETSGCASGDVAEFRVCEECATNVWVEGYSRAEKEAVQRALAAKRPIGCSALCGRCGIKVGEALQFESGGVHACLCSYWGGKVGVVKRREERLREVREAIANVDVSGSRQRVCVLDGCERPVVNITDREMVWRCNYCLGFVKRDPGVMGQSVRHLDLHRRFEGLPEQKWFRSTDEFETEAGARPEESYGDFECLS